MKERDMKLFRQRWFWWCFLAGLIVLSLIWAAYRFNWLGTGFQGKTLWDWLQLLIIPVVLALIALFFNQANTRTERQLAQKRYEQDKEIAQQRYEQDQKIAQQRYEQDQQIALDRQREDLLQAYLDCMSELLLEKGLRTSQADSEVRIFARVRTLTILAQLDGRRVGYVFRFLREAGLADAPNPIVNLQHGDLSGVNWSGANLSGANLSQINLSKANLSRADFDGANLSGANLSEADLSRTKLHKADFSKTELDEALLVGIFAWDASFQGANLAGANLSGAIFSEGVGYLGNTDHTLKIDKSQLAPEQIAQAIWD